MKSEYSVNQTAENICVIVATIMLVVFSIIGFILLCIFSATSTFLYGLLSCLTSITIGIITWTSLRIIANISRSLYNINDNIRNTNNEFKKTDETSVDDEESDNFKIGQLVIDKKTENQFRISQIRDNGIYSEKFDKLYPFEDVQDFNKYWAEKKKN